MFFISTVNSSPATAVKIHTNNTPGPVLESVDSVEAQSGYSHTDLASDVNIRDLHNIVHKEIIPAQIIQADALLALEHKQLSEYKKSLSLEVRMEDMEDNWEVLVEEFEAYHHAKDPQNISGRD